MGSLDENLNGGFHVVHFIILNDDTILVSAEIEISTKKKYHVHPTY